MKTPLRSEEIDALLGKLNACWPAVEAVRFDDPFASRALARFGRALAAYHEALIVEAALKDEA